MEELDASLHRIGQHHFRAEFRLHGRDCAVVERRLTSAEPRNDGRQTPYGGHPVQYADLPG